MQKYLIGTLFDEEEQDKKTNLSNIKAKDPMGNTRWKGAFTGGFQAGYKNTCGTKEGWIPAQFISSVAKRHQKVEQNVMDYMDKQDFGRQSITNNIALANNFQTTEKNSLNISLKESIGQKIINRLKKQQAFNNAPENTQDLHKLLQMYAKQEQIESNSINYELKDLQFPCSVNAANQTMEDDDFISQYQELYKQVIRGHQKQQTEEQLKKRKQQNKIYFDFTKPLQDEPQYLKEIQQIDSFAKPKKRRKNVINTASLKDIFLPPIQFQQFKLSKIKEAPEDYDPFHRIRSLHQDKFQKSLIENQANQQKKKSYNFNRKQLLGQNKLASRFVSSKSVENSFLKNDEKVKELKKFFQDQKKNQRYHDYVLELEGKKISAQLEYKSYEEAQKERIEFQQTYDKDRKNIKNQQSLPKQIEEALTSKERLLPMKVQRIISSWRPQKLLCKRFSVLTPYRYQN